MTKNSLVSHVPRWLRWGVCTGVLGLVCWLFQTKTHQAAQWRGAYFSMAANLDGSGRFLVDTAEMSVFDALPPGQQAAYRFRRQPPHALTEYVFMQTGYGYFCALARWLCPVGGDSEAIVALQVTAHIGLCLWLLSLLPVGWRRAIFFVGYTCNPFIIKYVTFDFYYFWQVIPSFLLVATYLGWRVGWRAAVWVGPLLGLLFVTRPALLGALLAVAGLWVWKGHYRAVLASLLLGLLVIGWAYRPVQSAPWRPVYVGVAAYQNPYMNQLSDMAMYTLFHKKTGHPYRYGSSDPVQEAQLTGILKTEVQQFWQRDPALFVRHAVLNTLLAFSVGYRTGGGDGLNYGLAALGLLVLGWLLWRRQGFFVAGVLATVGTFTPYYPPIPAYAYGAYLLLIVGLMESVLPRTRR